MSGIAFLLIAVLTVASACVVTFSRNILHSGFALLGTFSGAAAFFILLSSDFMAVAQVLIYVGGVLILVLFAIMLTRQVGDANVTNLSINRLAAAGLMAAFLITLWVVLGRGDWMTQENVTYPSMIAPLGNALIKEYVLPFELVSLLLIGALVGALVILRREVRN